MKDEVKQKRLNILARVDYIVDNHCKGCEFNNDDGKEYCNNTCQYGKELLQLGGMLGKKDTDKRTKVKKKKEDVKVVETKEPELIKSAEVDMTKEEFKRLYTEGFKKQEIAKKMGITPGKMSNLVNNKWGLNGWKPNKKKNVVAESVEEPSETELLEVYTKEDPTRKLHAEIMRLKVENEGHEEHIARLKKENEKIGKLREENEELRNNLNRNLYEYKQLENARDRLKKQAENLEGLEYKLGTEETKNKYLAHKVQEYDQKFLEMQDRMNNMSLPESEPVETDEERAYAYNTLKKDYQRNLDSQQKAYEEMEMQLDKSYKRFDDLEKKYDAACYALKMLL